MAPLPGECKCAFTDTPNVWPECPHGGRIGRIYVSLSPQRPESAMPIALYEPDIPQNTGTLLRLCACLGIEAHIIGPAGFPTTDRAFRRAGMDYLDAVAIVRHTSWQAFETWRRANNRRLVLFTTAASASYLDYKYRVDDMLLFGREFGRCAARGPRCSRCPSDDPDASRLAFAQCRTRRRHGCRRDAAADRD